MSFEPFPYQSEGIAFLKANRKAFLFDDPGLGKTAQALWALNANKPALVICPKAAKQVWFAECLKLRTDIQPFLIKNKREFVWPKQNQLMIINPDLIPDLNSMVSPSADLQICVDECHQFKNPKAIRTKLLTKLIHLTSGTNGSAWFFTGTPILSSPLDMWGLISSLGIIQETYGSWDNFKSKFRGHDVQIKRFVTITKFPSKPNPGAMDPLKSYVLRRTKAQVLPQLPTKRYEQYKVEAKYENQIKLTEEEIEAGAQAIPHVMQWRKDVSLSKVYLAGEFIAETAGNEPVVVFSAFKSTVKILAAGLRSFGIISEEITGEDSATSRTESVSRFQNGQANCICGTIGAMGVALTLTKAARVIFIDRDWTPALNLQAEDRVCRIGQTRGVIVTDVVCDDPVDEMVNRVLRKKQQLIQNTTEVL